MYKLRRGCYCGASCGWRGDDERPAREGRRNAGVHGRFRGAGDRPGGVVAGCNRHDEAVVGGERVGARHGLSHSAVVTEVLVGEGEGLGGGDGA